jgi:hypothetical protein
VKWLNRDLIVGPYLVLCRSESEFHRVMKHCNVPRDKCGNWIGEGSDARTHELLNAEGQQVAVVCINATTQHPCQIASLLVHEAVHVWQFHRDRIGERNPSSEFEAYSIQSIAQRLLFAFAETVT